MAVPGRGTILRPSKHRVVIYPAGDGFTWTIKMPVPDQTVVAVSAGRFTRVSDAQRAATTWFKNYSVNVFLAQKQQKQIF